MSRSSHLQTRGTIETRRHRRAQNPLAYARLWTPRCEECGAMLVEIKHPVWRCPVPACAQATPARHTSQAHAIRELGRDATAVFGGNGTGKTELGAMLAVAVALGASDSGVAAWASTWGLNMAMLPRRPGRVLASALTSADSRRYLRPKLKKYLPTGCVWRNEFGDGEAEVTLPNGGMIVLKSNDQGRRSYQGDWFDLVWLDEEHDSEVFEECEGRVSRVPGGAGHIVITMTPLKGFTWVYESFVKNCPREYRAHWLDGLENPYTDLEKMKRWFNRLPKARRAARKEGRFTALEGVIFDVDRALHWVPSFLPPAVWRRFRGIDFGTRNPFCCLWAALDSTDDTLHLYREHYQAGLQTRIHGDLINELSKEETIEWTVADPEDKQARVTLVMDCNIETLPAYKAVREGIDTVAERLLPDIEGRPHLVIHDCCPQLLAELEQYRWASGDKEAPLKVKDHAVDALRYLVLMLKRLS